LYRCVPSCLGPRAVSAELATTLFRVVWGHVPYENTSCAARVVRVFGDIGVLGMRARCIVDVGSRRSRRSVEGGVFGDSPQMQPGICSGWCSHCLAGLQYLGFFVKLEGESASRLTTEDRRTSRCFETCLNQLKQHIGRHIPLKQIPPPSFAAVVWSSAVGLRPRSPTPDPRTNN
jgi:hypothetical protein